MVAAATAATTAAISALRASGHQIDARTFAGDLLGCMGIAIMVGIVLIVWINRT